MGKSRIRGKSKEMKQEEAKERDDLRAQRSPQEQLDCLDKADFRALKERARLQKIIQKKNDVK
jgi:hypothetical protein